MPRTLAFLMSGQAVNQGLSYIRNYGVSGTTGDDVLCQWAQYKDVDPSLDQGYGELAAAATHGTAAPACWRSCTRVPCVRALPRAAATLRTAAERPCTRTSRRHPCLPAACSHVRRHRRLCA